MEVLQYYSFSEEGHTKNIFVDYGMRSGILEPEKITRTLGIEPTRKWSKDDIYWGKKLDVNTQEIVSIQRKRPWGVWAIDTSVLVDSKRVEEHITFLLDLLRPVENEIQKLLTNIPSYNVSFYIRWEPIDGHGSYEISSKSLHQMSKLCHHVEFNFLT